VSQKRREQLHVDCVKERTVAGVAKKKKSGCVCCVEEITVACVAKKKKMVACVV
jgi:hypothetical protein